MDEYITKKKDLLEEIKNTVIQNSAVTEMISIHKEILNKKEVVLNANHFQNYLNKLASAEDYGDECEVKHVEADLICPFQQKKIVNPFKNRECGHKYERDGLENFVTMGSSRCPYTGCEAIIRR